jgi:hypothetical protein
MRNGGLFPDQGTLSQTHTDSALRPIIVRTSPRRVRGRSVEADLHSVLIAITIPRSI